MSFVTASCTHHTFLLVLTRRNKFFAQLNDGCVFFKGVTMLYYLGGILKNYWGPARLLQSYAVLIVLALNTEFIIVRNFFLNSSAATIRPGT